MINTKFKSADPTTSLQALWVEVENADKIKFAEIADLRVRVKKLEDARQVAKEQVYPSFRRRLNKLEKTRRPKLTPFKWPWQ